MASNCDLYMSNSKFPSFESFKFPKLQIHPHILPLLQKLLTLGESDIIKTRIKFYLYVHILKKIPSEMVHMARYMDETAVLGT